MLKPYVTRCHVYHVHLCFSVLFHQIVDIRQRNVQSAVNEQGEGREDESRVIVCERCKCMGVTDDKEGERLCPGKVWLEDEGSECEAEGANGDCGRLSVASEVGDVEVGFR